MRNYTRVAAAPRFQISFETGKLFKALPPEGKDRVFRAFHRWFEAARKRGAEYWDMEPDIEGLTEDEIDCLTSMSENTSDGLAGYWAHCKDGVTPGRSGNAPEHPETTNEREKDKPTDGTNDILSEEAPPPAQGVGFTPPTVDAVRTYAKEHDLTDDAEKFLAYYRAHGWRYKNGDPLTSWQAAYSLWVLRETRFQQPERRVAAQQYEQREYDEAEMREILGTRSLYK